MSAFSDLDAAADPGAWLAYLDDTDQSLAAMKAYAAAAAARYARGDLVLDLGCGVGHDLARLAAKAVLPVGVDISARALSRAKAIGHPIVRGDAARLPFATSVFAGCRIERLLQHVADPGRVLDEVLRVVRPGGFVAVFEPDYNTFRVDSTIVPDGTLPARFVAVRHPSVGTEVPDLLRARGCTVVDIVTETSFAYRLDALPLDASTLTQRGVDAGGLAPEVRDAWLAEQDERVRTGNFAASWSKILTVAHTRPAAAWVRRSGKPVL